MPRHDPNASCVGELLFGAVRRPRTKDHARLNVKAIRETERQVREAREAREAEERRMRAKPRQFHKVQSRHLDCATSNLEKKDFLRRGARSELIATRTESRRCVESPQVDTPRKDPLPKTRARLKPRGDTNFVAKNKELPERLLAACEEKKTTALHDDFGTVPAYLSQRKAELIQKKADAEQRSIDDCPPGMTKMADDERVSMLESLSEEQRKIKADLDRLPLSVNTLRQAKRKEELESRLDELDKSIAIFRKPVVYVQA